MVKLKGEILDDVAHGESAESTREILDIVSHGESAESTREILDDVAHGESAESTWKTKTNVTNDEMNIPALHFPRRLENMLTLKELDLSRTNIQSLPSSIFMLSLLEKLTLQECSMLMELPPEIGKLKNLMTFDLEGTEIMHLPKEMEKLEKLQCLRVSFCSYADEYTDSNGIENIIPRTIMSKFRKLEELSMFVNPDAKWWEVEVIEAIAENLHFLPCLHTLKLYLPTVKVLHLFLRLEICQVPIYSTLQNFRLKIGHGEQLTTCLNTRLVESFEKLEKCLKYENGEGSTDDIKELIRHAKSLFVCRHWTIEKLSVFDISSLKYCLLAECNEMHTIVDADEFYGDKVITEDHNGKDAFESLEYLAVHSMKNLQSIWKGPIARNSFSSLQVLALHTCPDLTTVFTEGMLDRLNSLTVVIVEDCPKVSTLVSQGSTNGNYGPFLPNLRRILLLDLPELVSISSGVYIAPKLDSLLVFNCLKLKLDYLSQDVKEIKGESEWWDALKNGGYYSRAFVPLKRDGDLMNQLAEDTNSFKVFHKLQTPGGASMMSASASFRTELSLYETKKHLDWGMFIRYLGSLKPPTPLFQCNSYHVIEFLKQLNMFGDIRVHVQSCVLFGHPNPGITCFCPLGEAWGTLEALATRLHDAYEENRLPYMLPFASGDIQSYLYKVRKSQEKCIGRFPIPMTEEKSDYGWSGDNSSSKTGLSGRIAGDSGAGTIHNEIQVFRSTGAVTGSIKFTEPPLGLRVSPASISRRGSKSADTRTEAVSIKLSNSIVDGRYMSLLMGQFRSILQVEQPREYSLPGNLGSTIFRDTLPHGSSITHEVQEYNYVKSNTMSHMMISDLTCLAMRASFEGWIQPLVEIYITERKTKMQNRFLQFNIEKWSTYEVKKLEWELLELLIEVWIKSVKTSLEYLFESEKQLCEGIFQDLGIDIEDICYQVIIQDYQIQVFNIIYTLSFSNPPPDKIFMILDLYETLDHFLNKVHFFTKRRELFQATNHTQLLTVLSDKIISSLSIFEMVLLYHESSVIFVGPVDPLPRYVMSYLYQLCDHQHALRKLYLPKLPSIDEDDLSLYSEELKGKSELSRHVIWIIMIMVSNLEGKAKLCEDGSAGMFFAMKNIHYIAHKIEQHKALMEVVGDDYFGKLILKFNQAKVKYIMLTLISE